MQGTIRSAIIVAVLLALAACSGGGSDVLLSAGGVSDGTFRLKAEREPLTLELSRPETPEDDDERVEYSAAAPTLDAAAAFYVVDEATAITIVAGPVADGAARVVVRSGVASSEASLVGVGDHTLFIARLVGHVTYDSIVAFDAAGEPLAVTDER